MFISKVREIYEEIHEQSMESNYEFLSEADMEGLGWSEPLAFRLCSSGVPTRHMMHSLYLRYPSVPLTKEENPWCQEVLLGKAKFHEDF